jgi:hypothetical protein
LLPDNDGNSSPFGELNHRFTHCSGGWESGDHRSGDHDVSNLRQKLSPERSPGMKASEVLGAKSLLFQERNGKGVTDRKRDRCAGRGR